jgi:hypothetical protein
MNNFKLVLAIVLMWLAATAWLIVLHVPSSLCALLGVAYGFSAVEFYKAKREF